MKRKLNLRKIITFGIYTLFIVLIIGCLIKIIFFNKKTVDVKVVNEIEKYNYSLNNNATAYYKSLFEELKNLLENDYNIEDYVKLVSKLFVTDVYTLDNKLNKNDIGGTQFVYADFVDDFNSIAQSTIYKSVENNMYGDRKQELPIVTEVIIDSIETKSFKYNDEIINDAYYVSLTVNYNKDLGYPKNIDLVLIKNNDKVEVVKMQTKES